MLKISRKKQIIFISLILLALAICIKNALGNGDFKVFLEAAKLVRFDENPYNKWLHVGGNGYCLYFYSPLWAMILIPFTYLPNFIPNLIWLFANVFFLYRIWTLLKNYFKLEDLSSKQILLILLLTFLMSFRFILYNFGMIQMTLFLLWSILESIRLFREDKVILGGVILALAINIKILPIVIIPYLIYRRNFKAVASVALFSVIFLLIPAIFLGWTKNAFLLSEWWSVINPSNPEHLIESDLGSHSLVALVPTLLTDTQGEIDMGRNILSLSKESAIGILNLIRVFLVLLTIYFLKWPPFKKIESKLFQIQELSYIILIVPLIFPHMQKYSFVLAIPVMFYLSHFVVVNSRFRNKTMKGLRWFSIVILMGLSFTLMTLSTDGIIGRHLNEITQHFKTITWGALLLIIALILASPKITIKASKFPLAPNKITEDEK